MKTIKSVKLNYVFYFLFLHLYHIVCFQFTVQRYRIISNRPFVQLLNREYQIPVATPYNVATVEGESAELFRVKVFVVLRMRMTTDVVAHIDSTVGAVAENQPHLKPAKVESLCYV